MGVLLWACTELWLTLSGVRIPVVWVRRVLRLALKLERGGFSPHSLPEDRSLGSTSLIAEEDTILDAWTVQETTGSIKRHRGPNHEEITTSLNNREMDRLTTECRRPIAQIILGE